MGIRKPNARLKNLDRREIAEADGSFSILAIFGAASPVESPIQVYSFVIF